MSQLAGFPRHSKASIFFRQTLRRLLMKQLLICLVAVFFSVSPALAKRTHHESYYVKQWERTHPAMGGNVKRSGDRGLLFFL